ncbi:hypothetical protein [Limnochorda sp.]|uniref:hypothetical protein n=1 Tax=Limnochorda sp. TaxID=1940279 RepID=UPI0039C330F1
MAGWLWIYLLGYVPQVLLLMYASLGLAGLRTSIARLVVPAFTLSLVTFGLRVSLPGQWYAPAQLVALILGMRFFRLASLLGAIAASALGFILVALADLVVVAPLLYWLGLSPVEASQNWLVYLLMGIVEGTLVYAAALAVWLKNLSVLPITRWEKVLAERREGQ